MIEKFDTAKQKKIIDEAWSRHKEFINLYPFRKYPERIDSLTSEQLYNPGADNQYFFNWIEHKLKTLGYLSIGSAKVWENARDNLSIFKELLKIVVNDSLSVADKIDSHWEDIKGFGGDRHIAKKIIFCYYPEEIIPSYKTEDLEELVEAVGIDYQEKSYEKYEKDYNLLSLGEKFELLNWLLLDFKKSRDEFKNWDNALFASFLYSSFPPSRINRPQNSYTARKTIKPFSSYGLIAEPKFEQEVVFLFSKYHIKLGFPAIITISPSFPDAEVLNTKGEHKKIEFEVSASDFLKHGHDAKACDFIVCWEDDLDEEYKKKIDLPIIISLKYELSD